MARTINLRCLFLARLSGADEDVFDLKHALFVLEEDVLEDGDDDNFDTEICCRKGMDNISLSLLISLNLSLSIDRSISLFIIERVGRFMTINRIVSYET